MTNINFVRPVDNVSAFTPRGELKFTIESFQPCISSFIIHPNCECDEERYCYCITVSLTDCDVSIFISPSGFRFSNGNEEYISNDFSGDYENNGVYYTWKNYTTY